MRSLGGLTLQALSLSVPSDALWRGLFELANPDEINYFERDAGSVVGLGVEEPLGQIVPRKCAFVRECYIELFAKVMTAYAVEKRVTASLTGTPGIGKSMFGLLFLVDLIRHQYAASPRHLVDSKFGLGLNGHIVYEHVLHEADFPSYYLIDVEHKSITHVDAKPLLWLDDKHSFLIKDGPCKAYDVKCSVLWVSSPRAGGFQKADEVKGVQFILPPWTADELVACWWAGCAPEKLFQFSQGTGDRMVREVVKDIEAAGEELEGNLEEAILRRWTADLGPVARRVFNPSKGYRFLKAAVDDVGNEELKGIVSYATSQNLTSNTNKFKYSHRLLLMTPSDDFESYEFVPSSVEIGRRILDKSFNTDVEEAKSLMGKMSGTHLGLVFEPYAHFMLSRGGCFPIRELRDDGQRGEELQLWLSEEQGQVDVTNEELASREFKLAADAYYIPTDPTFAVVDSWTSKEMFQMTVSTSHPIKSGSKQFLRLKEKGVGGRLIFVVPKDYLGSFSCQPFVAAKTEGKSKGASKIAASSAASCPPKGGWNDVKQFVLGL